jgi:uncharacterized OB-fold protein
MKVEYEDDGVYLVPKCPACNTVPTYNMNPCPWCGEELEYLEGVEVQSEDEVSF